MTGRSADLRWLIDLCRHDLGGRARPFGADVDPEAVAALADAHRVPVIADRAWRALAERSPAPRPPQALRECAVRARHRSLSAATHLVRLERALGAAGVPWIALKGPALSMQLYGDATVRTARDLDVIVPRDGLAAAVAAVEGVGWRAQTRWRALMRITARYDMELPPTIAGQPLLELHHALGPRFVQFALDPFASGMSGTVPIAGRPIPALTGPALATYVAWHGARGLWYRLAWLVDYARLLPSRESEARELIATARACGAEVAVRAGALLAERLFAVAPPPWPPARPPVARRTERVVGWAVERSALGVDSPRVWSRPGSYRWLWREVAQQDDPWRSGVHALIHLARPTEADAERLGLGLPLGVHQLARPCFVIGRLIKDVARRA